MVGVFSKAHDFAALSSLFAVSELRGMNRASVVLRGLLRREKARFQFSGVAENEIGLYVLGEESSIANTDMAPVWSALDGAPADLSEAVRKIPAKGFVALPTSRVGAQLAEESGARGPLACVHFERPAIEFMLDEIESDLQSGCARGFLLAAFLEREKDWAYLAFGDTWNADLRQQVQASLEEFFKEGAQ